MSFCKAENEIFNVVILTNVKIFRFPHRTCRIIGQYALYGKENLIVSEYNYKKEFVVWGKQGSERITGYLEENE